jgi:hypothetical protein
LISKQFKPTENIQNFSSWLFLHFFSEYFCSCKYRSNLSLEQSGFCEMVKVKKK